MGQSALDCYYTLGRWLRSHRGSHPPTGGITLDMGAMQRILALDETNMLVRVQASMMGHVLERALNGRGYTLIMGFWSQRPLWMTPSTCWSGLSITPRPS